MVNISWTTKTSGFISSKTFLKSLILPSPVDPEKFREDISKILGMQKSKILDVYSFTETDCVHAECEHHNKHVLPWQDVIVRDVETLEPVEMGEKGLMNVINPIAHSYAGV